MSRAKRRREQRRHRRLTEPAASCAPSQTTDAVDRTAETSDSLSRAPESIRDSRENSARGESGLTYREDQILTERAIRRRWIPGPFPTDATKDELERIESDPAATLQERLVLSVSKGIDSCDLKRVSSAEKSGIAMVRTNVMERKNQKTLPSDSSVTNIQNNIQINNGVRPPTIQEVIQEAIASGVAKRMITQNDKPRLLDVESSEPDLVTSDLCGECEQGKVGCCTTFEIDRRDDH